MKTETKELLLNYLLLLGVGLILVVGVVLGIYYFNYRTNECVSSPFVFGAKAFTEEFGYEFVGSGFLQTPINIRSPTISFNSTDLWVVD